MAEITPVFVARLRCQSDENGAASMMEAWKLTSYAYDGRFRRTTKTDGATTTHFYYNDRWKCVEEWESTSTTDPVRQYVWGARSNHRDELVLRDRDATGGGTLDERLYCLMDYFDPTAMVDTSGSVVERYAFTAFGLRTIMEADWTVRTSSAYAVGFAFHGQFLDTETGYYDYGYRYYSPNLGRWLSRDPIAEQGGVNLYGFTRNSAVNGNDLLGLEVSWTNHPTERVTFDTYDLKLGYGEPGRHIDRDRTFQVSTAAAAGAEWKTEVVCEKKNNKYCVESATVDFNGIMYLRAAYPYGMSGVTLDEAETAENQHLDDFYGWANERGREHADNWIDKYSRKFDAKEECERIAAVSLSRNLYDSFKLTWNASSEYWDEPRNNSRHLKGSDNYLMGDGPEIPENPELRL